MENEFDNDECVFKLDYSNQSLKGNKEFQNWKARMLKRYGNDAKLFKCTYDNCYFYGINKECKTKPYYLGQCPICSCSLCYYCLKPINDLYNRGRCCVKRKILCMFLQDGYSFIKPEPTDEVKFYYSYLKIFFIPIVSFMFFVAYFTITYFYKISMKDSDIICESIFNRNERAFSIEIAINVGFVFTLAIPFFILDIYFKILLLIFSLPFKNYPLKYYFGILYQGFRQV